MAEALRFPAGFLWGAATSAHQVEGNNTGSDWWAWEQAGRTPLGEVSGEACDHWHRYADDIALAKKIGHTAYRFSVEWSRVEPRPGEFDPSALAHYRDVVATCRRLGVTPVVTLWHFTLPQWFARRGGWTNRNAVRWFARYVGTVADAFGADVPYWCTVNEPNVYVLQSYFLGIWPPQQRSIPRAIRVHRALVRAHRAAAAVVKQRFGDRTMVGFAENFNAFEPDRPKNPLDRLATRIVRAVWNGWFVRQASSSSDFIGVNYYFHSRVRFSPLRFDLLFVDLKDGGGAGRSDLGWEIDPKGFGQVVTEVARYGKPILITENGLADADDSRRPRFLLSHLAALHGAIAAGADVRGYLHWSLLDNYEWAHGFEPRFGLIAVDYVTKRRSPRPSAELYRTIIKSNAVPADALALPLASR